MNFIYYMNFMLGNVAKKGSSSYTAHLLKKSLPNILINEWMKMERKHRRELR